MGVIIAIISGLLMSVQGVWNTEVTKTTGMWVCNSFVQLTAFLTALVMWYVTDHQSFMRLGQVTPRYFLLGGLIGTGITYTVVKSMEYLGPAKAVILIVVAQTVVAYAIELWGLFGVEKSSFEIKKFIGLCLCLTGIILFKQNH